MIGFDEPELQGVVKIGVTNNIKRRIDQLQTGCPWRLVVKAMVYDPDAYTREGWLHSHFHRQRIRSDGEWFDFGPGSDPVDIISRAR